MPAELAPGRAIVPIVRATKNQPVIEVLGTGFFVGTDSTLHLVTAKHVFESNPLTGDERYAVAFHEEKGIKILASNRIIGHPDFDIAVCDFEPADFPEAVRLCIGRSEAALNADIMSYEYSSTRIERKGSGTQVSFEPYTHKGNIVRSYESLYPEKIATPSVDVSFPALQGASGAPLLTGTASKKSFTVVGMIVANVERHLLPAQIVKVHDKGLVIEERSYFLPYGKALARSVIAKCLEQMGIPFSYAEDMEAGPLKRIGRRIATSVRSIRSGRK